MSSAHAEPAVDPGAAQQQAAPALAAVMLFWALLASGQITMRRVDGWQTLDRSLTDLDLAA